MGRPARAALAIVVLLAVAGAGLLVAPPARAASGRVLLTVTDPLSTDPVRLQVAATDVDGWAAAFTGTVTLSVGKTSVGVPVSSPIGQTEVAVPTTTLKGGPVKATVVLRVSGKTVRTTVAGLLDLPASVVLRGFGCGVVTPAQPRLVWQVATLNGRPIAFPGWTQAASTYPAYIHTVRPATIADSQGRPLSTKGSVVITQGTTTVATIAMKPAVRRLLFSTAWSGRVKGAFAPGAYTATITLTDPYGRRATATRSVIVAKSAVGLCL